jgi:hypothetical protein
VEAAGGACLVDCRCWRIACIVNAGSNIFLRFLEKFVPFSDIVRHSQIVSRSEDGSIGAPL